MFKLSDLSSCTSGILFLMMRFEQHGKKEATLPSNLMYINVLKSHHALEVKQVENDMETFNSTGHKHEVGI